MKKHTQLKRYLLLENKIIDIYCSNNKENVDYNITNSGTLYLKYTYSVVDDWYADIGYVTHEEKCREKIGKVLFATDNVETIINRFLSENKDFWCNIYYLHSSLLNRFNNNVKLNKKDLKSAYKIILYEYEDDNRHNKEIKYTFLNNEKQYFTWEMYEGEV